MSGCILQGAAFPVFSFPWTTPGMNVFQVPPSEVAGWGGRQGCWELNPGQQGRGVSEENPKKEFWL